ncbi:MAG: PIG-L family deacetylase [Waddliaceae bacterium]
MKNCYEGNGIFTCFSITTDRIIWFFTASLLICSSYLSASESNPKILAVVAHPDDETQFAATLYKISHEMGGTVDVVMITNGEGGYKYSTLAEPIYHMKLTDEKVGRQRLPFIRKNEALNGGKILGVRNYFFLEEKDTGYTQDPSEVLQGAWNVNRIKQMLNKLILEGQYDYIFVMLPTQETHGHHKAATILALEVVKELMENKPTILAAKISEKNENEFKFNQLDDFPITKTQESPIAFVDKTKKFGFNDRLDYKIVVNWVIAEHKSQGTMQLYMNRGDYENFYFFELNSPEKIEKTIKLFNQLAVVPSKHLTRA